MYSEDEVVTFRATDLTGKTLEIVLQHSFTLTQFLKVKLEISQPKKSISQPHPKKRHGRSISIQILTCTYIFIFILSILLAFFKFIEVYDINKSSDINVFTADIFEGSKRLGSLSPQNTMPAGAILTSKVNQKN